MAKWERERMERPEPSQDPNFHLRLVLMVFAIVAMFAVATLAMAILPVFPH